MTLSIHRIEAISRTVAQEYDPRLAVVSVASRGGSARVELLVTIDRYPQRPCLLMMNVTRAGAVALEQELGKKLRDALRR